MAFARITAANCAAVILIILWELELCVYRLKKTGCAFADYLYPL